MNYTELSTLIQDTTSNYESIFISNIPEFIRTAERRIYSSVQLPVLRKAGTGTMTIGDPDYTLPADWLATYSISVVTSGSHSYLTVKDLEYIREAYPDPTVTGVPRYYAQTDDSTITVGPTPAAAYVVNLSYYHHPDSIVSASTTWLGDNYPNVLLYGALREAYVFMKGEPDVIKMYEDKYNEDLMLLKQLGDGKNRADTYRTSQTRVPVA